MVVFWVLAVSSITPWVSPAVALILGIAFVQIFQHPYPAHGKKYSKLLLKVSVVGLGFGLNFTQALEAGKEGFLFTVASISGTLILGAIITTLLSINKKTGTLISTGTAICGGSAIAAVAPVIKAGDEQMSVSLGTVFLLNAIALFIFPPIGHWLQLTQQQFGLWSAIAIHDTSSVVGAASAYGNEALAIATTVKLMRALWIIPLVLVFALLEKKGTSSISIPWFIGFFVLAMLANSFIPGVDQASPYLVVAAKAGFKLTLFLIGTSLAAAQVKAVGIKPLVLGVMLWLAIGLGSLAVIYNY